MKPESTLLIGDKAHGLDLKQLRNALTARAEMRLGLSATPRRWYDDEGTGFIFSYFGKTCFEYSLDDAIGNYFTPYHYYPQLVSLSDDEIEEYEDLTARAVVLVQASEHDADAREKPKKLLLQRARIISSAEEKLPAMLELLQSLMRKKRLNGQQTRAILIYCAPGTLKAVLQGIAAPGLRCHDFVANVSLPDWKRLLRQFAAGDIQVLVAIKYLDEGVDVPSTRTASVLASSTNPREFVQRRGHIPRLAEGKNEAVVYDLIVAPSPERWALKNAMDVSILKREMPRFVVSRVA